VICTVAWFALAVACAALVAGSSRAGRRRETAATPTGSGPGRGGRARRLGLLPGDDRDGRCELEAATPGHGPRKLLLAGYDRGEALGALVADGSFVVAQSWPRRSQASTLSRVVAGRSGPRLEPIGTAASGRRGTRLGAGPPRRVPRRDRPPPTARGRRGGTGSSRSADS